MAQLLVAQHPDGLWIAHSEGLKRPVVNVEDVDRRARTRQGGALEMVALTRNNRKDPLTRLRRAEADLRFDLKVVVAIQPAGALDDCAVNQGALARQTLPLGPLAQHRVGEAKDYGPPGQIAKEQPQSTPAGFGGAVVHPLDHAQPRDEQPAQGKSAQG